MLGITHRLGNLFLIYLYYTLVGICVVVYLLLLLFIYAGNHIPRCRVLGILRKCSYSIIITKYIHIFVFVYKVTFFFTAKFLCRVGFSWPQRKFLFYYIIIIIKIKIHLSRPSIRCYYYLLLCFFIIIQIPHAPILESRLWVGDLTTKVSSMYAPPRIWVCHGVRRYSSFFEQVIF